MLQLRSVSHRAQVLDTMIALTRLSHLQRAIIAGSGGMELYLGLRRRGFMRVTTVSTRASAAAARHRPTRRSQLGRP